jgi:hypothetical protein
MNVRIPLYSGIFVVPLAQDGLAETLIAALAGGASGIVVFHATGMNDAHWETFHRVTGSARH